MRIVVAVFIYALGLDATFAQSGFRSGAEPVCYLPTPFDSSVSTTTNTRDSRHVTNGFHIVRRFRLAVAASGEYTQFHGGTVESASQAIATVVNRVNEIYYPEIGILLNLVTNNEVLVFTNSLTDPFTVNNPSITTIAQAQAVFDQKIGSENYDLGILLNTGTYGLAYLGSVCHPQRKGSACMGLPEPTGERFYIFVAHEIAHQFGATHSFNAAQGFCVGNREPASAVEPGTGSTLLSYAGLDCGNSYLQPLMDDYFHARSIAEIASFLGEKGGCAEIIVTSNRPPFVYVEDEHTIPILTPFVVEAFGLDPDDDALTYCWEQMNVGPPQTFDDPDNGLSPLFRSFPPVESPSRTFPKMVALLGNTNSPGETLPQTNRTLRFRVTVRDSRNMGASGWASLRVHVTDSAGPFRISSHNQRRFVRGEQIVTWDVAGTTNLPIDAAHVNIRLSTNGGETFSISLATHTPNDGSELVVFPTMDCPNARIKIEAVENIFFDINDAEIQITTQPFFTSIQADAENVVLRWNPNFEENLRVETAFNLSATNWTPVNIRPERVGSERQILVPRSAGSAYFRLGKFDESSSSDHGNNAAR